jgi:hypothetical protein
VTEPVTEAEQLARLHEFYVWQVNAAVGEGRMDLVEELANQYTEDALELMTAGSPGQEPGPVPPP